MVLSILNNSSNLINKEITISLRSNFLDYRFIRIVINIFIYYLDCPIKIYSSLVKFMKNVLLPTDLL